MWDAIEQADLERYATYIHEDFTSFGETDTYLNEGKAYEMRGVKNWTDRSRNIHTEMHQAEVTVRGDVAWSTYYWTDESYSADTGQPSTSRGKSTRIFVREGGRWLCIHGHYTLVD
jgi:ketosteroid isomerase-like protein